MGWNRTPAYEQVRKLKEDQADLLSQVQLLMQQAEKAGDEGDVDGAGMATAEAQALGEQAKALGEQIEAEKTKSAEGLAAQTVCPTCGSINNLSDEGAEKHIESNRHVSWIEIRRVLKDLRTKVLAHRILP